MAHHKRPPLLLLGLAVCLLVIGFVSRFWHLSAIPVALYHDELDHVFTAEAVARYGTDITGQWSPFSLRPLQTINYTAELAAVFHAVVQVLAGFGAMTAHLPNAIFGLLTTGVAAGLAYLLTGRKQTALLAGVLLLTTPWHIHISRMTYEATISVCFQLLFVTTVTFALTRKLPTPNQRVLLALLLISSFFLGYFTYHGAKFTLVAVGVVSAVGLAIQARSQTWRWLLSGIIVFTLLVHLGHTVWLQHQQAFGSRESELIMATDTTESIVNDRRRLSLALPVTNVFINKPAVIAQAFLQRYASVFEWQKLFITGYESGPQFSLMVGGFFWLSFLLFIPLGIRKLWRQNQRLALFFFTLILVSPITSAITIGYQSIFRSALTYVLLVVCAGIGLSSLWDWLAQAQLRPLRLAVIAIVVLESIWFSYHYFSRYPILAADNHSLSDRLVANYVTRLRRPLTVVVEKEPYTPARALVSYAGVMPSLSDTERQQFSQPFGKEFTLGDVVLTELCSDLRIDQPLVVDEERFENCGYKDFLATASANPSSEFYQTALRGIGSPLDSRSYYVLINDPLCTNESLATYVHAIQVDDFYVEKLSDSAFCQTWVLSR